MVAAARREPRAFEELPIDVEPAHLPVPTEVGVWAETTGQESSGSRQAPNALERFRARGWGQESIV